MARLAVRRGQSRRHRPGRFDYILPVGPPDADARRAIFARHLAATGTGTIGMEKVLAATDGYTPADIRAVCDEAAHRAFEHEVKTGRAVRVETEDLLDAPARQKASITAADIRAFRADVAHFCRADYCPV